MRKSFVAIVAVALVAALAVPAMAEVSLTGFYRAKGYVSNFYNAGAGDWSNSKIVIDENTRTASYVDQRFRAKVMIGDENVKAVYFGELNEVWGQAATGGQLSADARDQLRTKNLYLWFKVPETPVDVTAGIQNVTDAYAGVIFGAADMSGVYANVKASDQLAFRLGWGQLYNEAIRQDAGVNLYVAEAKFAANKDVNVGANLYVLRDATSKISGVAGNGTFYVPGVNFTAKVNDQVGLTGFVFGQFGKFEADAGGDTKLGGFAGDLRADVAAGPAKVFVEGLYTSGDGNSSDDKYKGVVVLDDYNFGTGASTFSRADLYIILPAADSIGTAGALTYDANNHGDGLVLIAAGATMPLTPKVTGKVGLGYAQAAKVESGKKDMGTEINANVNWNVAKGLDANLAAAYCFLGKYFTEGWNPDDPYAVVGKLNYAF